MAGAVCVGIAEVEVDTVEDLIVLLFTTILSVDEVLVRVRGRTDDVGVLDLMYISSLFPAPQYSYALPGQIKEQSVKAARTDPALITLPQ
jgi:hypothetical protein